MMESMGAMGVVNNCVNYMESKSQMISTALVMRANYLETGDVTLTRNDAINMKCANIIKPLDEDQQELVLELRRLARKILDGGLC